MRELMTTTINRGRRRTVALLAGLLSSALVLSGCSIYDLPLPGGASTGSNPLHLTLMFRDVLDLVPQSTVKVDDVTVGKVKSIKLKGYVAEVEVQIPHDVKLPSNTTAQIRQTSLLGEKFIALDRPQNPGSGTLANNDVIGLDRTGRNPEVEEVFSALALLLNGGGVGQLKTIVSELNNTFSGHEDDVRSVLTQIRTFMGQLDDNKTAVVAAIENTNRLAAGLRSQDTTIKSALDHLPRALQSVNGQRADLVKLLKALTRLSSVGVKVIQASKTSTINSLRDLAPVLDGFAKAGQSFPKSLQVFLTYPFVDAAVGRDPQVARNLHMGDFTNLSIRLDLNIADLNLPDIPPITIPPQLCDAVKTARRYAHQRIYGLPGLTAAQKKAIDDAVQAKIEDDDCTITLNTVRKYIAAALLALGGAVTATICPQAGPILCNLIGNPTALPTITLGVPQLGTGNGGVGGLLPRAQLNGAYQAPKSIDPFHLAKLGLDPGIGTMLFQGVAEVR
jgi:phospholipid/cholesterol/gamma-HCH transport system substrate-binding protein